MNTSCNKKTLINKHATDYSLEIQKQKHQIRNKKLFLNLSPFNIFLNIFRKIFLEHMMIYDKKLGPNVKDKD